VTDINPASGFANVGKNSKPKVLLFAAKIINHLCEGESVRSTNPKVFSFTL
jgi:hypothetical protein